MTATLPDAQFRFVRAVEGMHMTARRLRHELDRMLAECGADNLRNTESHAASRVLVNTSALLMVLQADVCEALETRAEFGDRILAEARTVMAALRAQMDGHDGERPLSASTGADNPPRAG